MRRLSLALVITTCLMLGDQVDGSGPTDLDPLQTFSVRESETIRTWRELLDEQYRELSRLMENLTARQPLTLGDVQALNAAYSAQLQVDRLATRLMELREPAGLDLHLRAVSHLTRIKEMAQQLKSDSEFGAFQNKLARDYVAETRKREKGLGKVRVLVKQGKWSEAEEALNGEQDDLEAGKLWLEDAVWGSVLGKFSELRREIADRVRRQYLEQNEASLREAVAGSKPNLKAESQGLQRAAQGLKTTPQTTYRGAPCSGPQLITAAMARLSEVQCEVLRYETLHWYLKKTRDAGVEQEYEALRSQFSTLVSEIISADAERATEAEVRPLYLDYLTALAPLVARSFDERVFDTLRLALEPLIEKSTELKAEVDSYEQATDGILAWRQRTAEAFARSRRKEYPDLVATYAAESRNLTPLRGLFSTANKPGSLYDPADALMRGITPLMINKKISLTQVDGSRAGAQSTASRLRGGAFATLPISPMPQAAIDLLKADLSVSADRPPLSLRSASALWGVEHGCVEEVGAEVTALEFQALAPRSLDVVPADSQFVHFAESATQEFIEPEKQVVTRFEVHPVWYRFRYQFVGP